MVFVGTHGNATQEVIHIPSASDNNSRPIGITVQCRYSSSEESDNEITVEDDSRAAGYINGKFAIKRDDTPYISPQQWHLCVITSDEHIHDKLSFFFLCFKLIHTLKKRKRKFKQG